MGEEGGTEEVKEYSKWELKKVEAYHVGDSVLKQIKPEVWIGLRVLIAFFVGLAFGYWASSVEANQAKSMMEQSFCVPMNSSIVTVQQGTMSAVLKNKTLYVRGDRSDMAVAYFNSSDYKNDVATLWCSAPDTNVCMCAPVNCSNQIGIVARRA